MRTTIFQPDDGPARLHSRHRLTRGPVRGRNRGSQARRAGGLRAWAQALAWTVCVLPAGVAAQEPGQVTFSHFSSVAALCVQGAAVPQEGRLRLTGTNAWESGAVWLGQRRFVGEGFETEFAFQISASGGAADPGEGFAFVVQGNALPALGPAGDGLGYTGLPASLAVEFDPVENVGQGDPASPHVSVHAGRALPNSAHHWASLGAVTNGLPDFADGTIHTGKVVCAGSTLQVFVDDLANPVLSVTLPSEYPEAEGSLAGLLGLDDGLAWVGFTASTSERSARHDLWSWSFRLLPAPLTVDWVAPADGASFLCPARITLEVAVASTGTVTRVEFFSGSAKLGETAAGPWQFTWKDVLAGTYWITAAATDDSGHKRVSVPRLIKVLPTEPPIGLSFSSGRQGANHPLAMTEQAGVVEQRVWNNLVSAADGSGLQASLRNGAGQITPARASWDAVEPDDEPSVNPNLSGDHKLMKAGLSDHGGAAGVQSNSVLFVQQIPFPFYDVVVYSDGANGAADRVAELRLGNQSRFLRDAPWASFAGSYVQAGGSADLGPATPAGNYVRFNGLTNSSFTLTLRAGSASDGTPRAVVNALQIIPSVSAVAPVQITRGPYLQTVTPTSIVVRWRTSRPTDSRVRFGVLPAALTTTNDDPAVTTEHIVQLTNLQPATLYYYAVGTTETNLVAGLDYHFITSPTSPVPTRIWFISDYGFRNSAERAVRDSYFNFIAPTRPADVWLSGGDNDQVDGRDSSYQNSVFGTDYGYGALLRQRVLWPTLGNHDYQTAQGAAYYANFTLPTDGAAGGVPSGSEHFYSFNYGDIHFVSLDSVDGSLSEDDQTPMFQWLRADLAAATQQWIIAFWHGAPYTKGSHDSDDDDDTLAWMTQMRQNALPILEAHGVDLVLCGHSHVYERTWLLQGHYGYSWDFSETNKLDAGDGRESGTGAYRKLRRGPGTVYVTAGVGSQPRSLTSQVHSAHLLKIEGTLGSVLVDVNGARLDCQFLNTNGVTLDAFTLSKEPQAAPPTAPTAFTATALAGGRIQLAWNHVTPDEIGFVLERSTDGVNFNPIARIGANMTRFVDAAPPLGTECFYRLRAWNSAGDSDFSNVATAGLVAPLRVVGIRPGPAAMTLTWFSEPGRTYAIEYTATLETPTWQPVVSGLLATGFTMSCDAPVPPGAPAGFYRVRTPSN